MTLVTAKLTQPIETIYFNPPLPPAKEMQLLLFRESVFFVGSIFCDIVEPLSSNSNFKKKESEPSQLIGLTPSPNLPIVKVQKSKDPINSIKISREKKWLRALFHVTFV